MTNHQSIIQWVQDANPELRELKPGCILKKKNGEIEKVITCFDGRATTLHSYVNARKEDLDRDGTEILGSPAHLHHVLRAIGKVRDQQTEEDGHGIFTDDMIMMAIRWNLDLEDNLEVQLEASPELAEFLSQFLS